MKTKTRYLFLAAILGLTLSACSSPGPASSAGTKPYPLSVCLVTDNDLDSMGGPVTKVYNGQQIKFCCEPCVEKFEANQAKYLAKLPG
jgi:YHS domain-containing protein